MRGAILTEQAYAQGKMLDHSGWAAKLPRSITPSDIDCVFANGQQMLACEISSRSTAWDEIATGQRRLYADKTASDGNQWSVLLSHNVPPDRAIRTDVDVQTFQVMYRKREGGTGVIPVVDAGCDGIYWQQFVIAFYTCRNDAYQHCMHCLSKQRCPACCFCERCRGDV